MDIHSVEEPQMKVFTIFEQTDDYYDQGQITELFATAEHAVARAKEIAEDRLETLREDADGFIREGIQGDLPFFEVVETFEEVARPVGENVEYTVYVQTMDVQGA